ncbi:hypothetical protein A3A60_04765 [Candidatus Curtissbacteria bacterium RIFCSPLOWO2_01_FULL_42_26]|uniref:HIT domain-containing protein n=1 Tax=Candidatus Curtissbacteria bacterium RIFCSPLOWO2_01_FULL_42_26 TaxID=1797729 RepID=A0A1F5I1Q5_9BACT|nr:MAG: hypothetical protein A3A60_04765 [Candidatus Curtissbacteria bacterium RIFCSPLOWO2_01_FULL_42_26]
MTSSGCIFCKIIRGEMKTKFVFDNDKVAAFADVNPVADTHILIVPKKHIEATSTVRNEDGDDLVEMFKAASILSAEKKLSAYRLTFNAGKYQHVSHLHMHLLAGNKIQWTKL